MSRAILLLHAAVFPFLVGCADVARKDPFAELQSVRESPAKDLTAVMALSQNTVAAMPYMNRYRGVGASAHGERLFKELADIFRKDFKSVVKADSIEAAK